ncbi:hypothetical protein H7F51_11085 [Novosphingobium flavum]|uniref:Uncharacterized protein n=1 Tax=Novosphingobium flavum TaxID=1778672 RepID=A0A7X1FSB6_9SPHN|nr:OmpH family outer membrane protein [Novosphingobium flavum]MBC2666061.1 hypothetical protein [Novosphingobium flavum]
MEDEEFAPPVAGRKKPFVLFRFWQWGVAALFALTFAALLGDYHKAALPGASPPLYYAALASAVATAALLCTPAFFRLPGKAKIAAYLTIIPTIMLTNDASVNLDNAYAKTPAGAKELAARRAEEAVQAEQDRQAAEQEAKKQQAQDLIAKLEEQNKQLAEIKEKLEACYSWGQKIPALSDAVRDSLHNPKSFEHVKTVLIVPDPDRRNVIMEFRAENGFGALRAAVIRAQVDPDDCSVSNIGEPVME